MADKNQMIEKLMTDLENEKKKTRWFKILELIGFVILVIGFVYLFVRTTQLKKAEDNLQMEVLDFEEKVAAANREIARKEDSLSTLGAEIVQSIELIDEENIDSARTLLGLAKKDYVDKVNNSILGVNELYIGNDSGKKIKPLTTGRLYAWAYINSPEVTKVSLHWISEDGHTWSNATKEFDIGVNTQRGYKVYDWKQFYNPGDYRVQVLGQNNRVIKELKFTVVSS